MMNLYRVSVVVICLALVGVSNNVNARPTPVGNAFTYQGLLNQSGTPVDGTVDFEFRLFDVPAGGSPINGTVLSQMLAATEGVFTAELDFGAGVFAGDERWLDISVRFPSGSGLYTTLVPRQRLNASPYSLFALNATIAGTQSGAINFTNGSNTYAGSGAGLTNLNASNLTSGTMPSAQFSGIYSSAVNLSHIGNIFTGSYNGNGAALTGLDASNISAGTLPIGRGGTGATTATAALTSLNAQARVTGTAPPGSYIRAIDASGNVTVGVDQDTNTTYTAGPGLQLAATTFSLSSTGAAAGEVLKWTGAAFDWLPDNDSGGDITTVTAGSGLTGGGTSGAVSLSVAANGITNTMLATDAASLNKVSGGIMSATSSAVGIGTSSPLFDFDVVRTPGGNNINPVAVFRQAGGSSSVGAIRFQNTAGNHINMGITAANDFAIGYNSNISLGTDVLRMTSTGNVGIGTTAPTAKLHVGGVAGTDGIKFPDGSLQVKAAITLRLTTSTFPVQALAGGASTSYQFSVSGATVGSAVVVNALSDLGSGLMIGPARVSSAGNVSFYVHNVSNAATAATSTQFTIAVIP